MKANKLQIALVGSAVVFASTPAFANEISGTRITSQPGITQSQWEATETYKAHTCPEGSGKGIGVDMNFTADRSDDTWFAYCVERQIIVYPKPIIDTQTTTVITPTVIETGTAVSSPTTNSNTGNTIQSTNTTAQLDTQTASTQETTTVTTITANDNSVMVSEWLVEIKRLINQLLALIARLTK
ncbi:hypothetical protein EB001_02330 [bacterium]|nr:hypothetical protein [bacterium]